MNASAGTARRCAGIAVASTCSNATERTGRRRFAARHAGAGIRRRALPPGPVPASSCAGPKKPSSTRRSPATAPRLPTPTTSSTSGCSRSVARTWSPTASSPCRSTKTFATTSACATCGTTSASSTITTVSGPKALDAYAEACQAAERAGDVVGVGHRREQHRGVALRPRSYRRSRSGVPQGAARLPLRRVSRRCRCCHRQTSGGSRCSPEMWSTGMEHLERAVKQFDDLGASAFVFSTRVRLVEALLVGGKCADALDLANSLLGRTRRRCRGESRRCSCNALAHGHCSHWATWTRRVAPSTMPRREPVIPATNGRATTCAERTSPLVIGDADDAASTCKRAPTRRSPSSA